MWISSYSNRIFVSSINGDRAKEPGEEASEKLPSPGGAEFLLPEEKKQEPEGARPR
jgi:hypothetical protein